MNHEYRVDYNVVKRACDDTAFEMNLPMDRFAVRTRDNYIKAIYNSCYQCVTPYNEMAYKWVNSTINGNLASWYANEYSIYKNAPMEWQKDVKETIVEMFKDAYPEREDLKEDYEEYGLPTSFSVLLSDAEKEEMADSEDEEEFVSDYITDKYGFCHNGFTYEIVGDELIISDVQWDIDEEDEFDFDDDELDENLTKDSISGDTLMQEVYDFIISESKEDRLVPFDVVRRMMNERGLRLEDYLNELFVRDGQEGLLLKTIDGDQYVGPVALLDKRSDEVAIVKKEEQKLERSVNKSQDRINGQIATERKWLEDATYGDIDELVDNVKYIYVEAPRARKYQPLIRNLFGQDADKVHITKSDNPNAKWSISADIYIKDVEKLPAALKAKVNSNGTISSIGLAIELYRAGAKLSGSKEVEERFGDDLLKEDKDIKDKMYVGIWDDAENDFVDYEEFDDFQDALEFASKYDYSKIKSGTVKFNTNSLFTKGFASEFDIVDGKTDLKAMQELMPNSGSDRKVEIEEGVFDHFKRKNKQQQKSTRGLFDRRYGLYDRTGRLRYGPFENDVLAEIELKNISKRSDKLFNELSVRELTDADYAKHIKESLNLTEGHVEQKYKGFTLDWNDDGVDPEEGIADFSVRIYFNGEEITQDAYGKELSFNGFAAAKRWIDKYLKENQLEFFNEGLLYLQEEFQFQSPITINQDIVDLIDSSSTDWEITDTDVNEEVDLKMHQVSMIPSIENGKFIVFGSTTDWDQDTFIVFEYQKSVDLPITMIEDDVCLVNKSKLNSILEKLAKDLEDTLNRISSSYSQQNESMNLTEGHIVKESTMVDLSNEEKTVYSELKKLESLSGKSIEFGDYWLPVYIRKITVDEKEICIDLPNLLSSSVTEWAADFLETRGFYVDGEVGCYGMPNDYSAVISLSDISLKDGNSTGELKEYGIYTDSGYGLDLEMVVKAHSESEAYSKARNAGYGKYVRVELLDESLKESLNLTEGHDVQEYKGFELDLDTDLTNHNWEDEEYIITPTVEIKYNGKVLATANGYRAARTWVDKHVKVVPYTDEEKLEQLGKALSDELGFNVVMRDNVLYIKGDVDSFCSGCLYIIQAKHDVFFVSEPNIDGYFSHHYTEGKSEEEIYNFAIKNYWDKNELKLEDVSKYFGDIVGELIGEYIDIPVTDEVYPLFYTCNNFKELTDNLYMFNDLNKATQEKLLKANKIVFDGKVLKESYDDWEESGIYGGDLTYCPICDTRLKYDEDGDHYCPKCKEDAHSLSMKRRHLMKESKVSPLDRAVEIYTTILDPYGNLNSPFDNEEDYIEDLKDSFKNKKYAEYFISEYEDDDDAKSQEFVSLLKHIHSIKEAVDPTRAKEVKKNSDAWAVLYGYKFRNEPEVELEPEEHDEKSLRERINEIVSSYNGKGNRPSKDAKETDFIFYVLYR